MGIAICSRAFPPTLLWSRKRILSRISPSASGYMCFPKLRIQIQFASRITLLGYTIESPQSMRPGSALSIVLAWRADQAVRERYVIFMHLLDTPDRIWAQGDREPGRGWFHTNRWDPGDLTNDRYSLELDATTPQGIYQIVVGLYDPDTGARLKTVDGSDAVILKTVNIPAK